MDAGSSRKCAGCTSLRQHGKTDRITHPEASPMLRWCAPKIRAVISCTTISCILMVSTHLPYLTRKIPVHYRSNSHVQSSHGQPFCIETGVAAADLSRRFGQSCASCVSRRSGTTMYLPPHGRKKMCVVEDGLCASARNRWRNHVAQLMAERV